jgi:2-polyprenyl-6-hydroxyphenyl methylase/3-demethylubiquinone-9 3-methyltransferase
MRDVQQFLVNFPNKELKILDYGAGSSVFGNELKGHGYDVESWDPMWGTAPTWSTEKKFDLMTSFEVFEHTPTPKETLREMKQWLAPNGKIFITTLVNDVMGDKRDPMFWYLAPRNGHVCMHSMKSIDALFSQIDMTVQHFGPSWHLASCE